MTIYYATDNAPQGRAIAPIDELRGTIVRMQPQFQAALPSHISPEKFQRVLLTAVGQNQALAKANRQSLFTACMKAAQDGLLPDGKEAALVQFGDAVTYMPMIAGILKKVRNSGELSSITAQIVHEKDAFNYYVDTDGEHMEWRPTMFGDRGKILGAFAQAKLTDGAVYIEVMGISEIEQIRNVSRAKDNGPWKTWWSEMAKKSVMRRLCKRLPMSTDLDQLFDHDNETNDLGSAPEPAGNGDGAVDVTPPTTATKRRVAARAAAAVGAGVVQGPGYTVEEIPETVPVEDPNNKGDGLDIPKELRREPPPAEQAKPATEETPEIPL